MLTVNHVVRSETPQSPVSPASAVVFSESGRGDHAKGEVSLGGHLTQGLVFKTTTYGLKILEPFPGRQRCCVPDPFFPATHYISAAVASVCNLRLLTLSAVLQLQGLCAIFGRPQLCM